MADNISRINTGRLRLFDRAVRGKWNKYTWSGLAILIAGLLILLVNTILRTGYPANVLLIGLAILFVLIGVIRILIGFINPATPLDIVPVETVDQSLQSDLFITPDPIDD